MSASRLRIDLKRLTKEAREGISAAPRENNILVWDAIVLGPPDTPWDGGIFKLTLKFSQDYPCTPPTVRFVSKMFHPNVDHHGFIFLDILKDQWNPFYDVAAILTSIQVLLNDPNPDLAVHEEAADLYCKDRKEYNRRVRNLVERSP